MAEYLVPKNWSKYQSLRGRGKWIMDYTEQDGDEDLCKLTLFQRMVLQGVRRIRGRLGKNVPYDPTYIASAIHALPTDRPHIGHALSTLISRGLLVVTPQQDDSPKAGENREERKEKDKKPPERKAPGADPRFHHCVEILHRYWDKFVNPKVRFEIWLDKAGYRQLKNSLGRSEALTVEDFTRCVANRARSPGVDHCEPAYKWLGHITDWAGGSKLNGKQQLTGDQRRIVSNREAIVSGLADQDARSNAGHHGSAVPHDDNSRASKILEAITDKRQRPVT